VNFLVDKICEFLTKKIMKKMPEIDDERAEIIDYGLHLVIGEIPKNFILLLIAYVLGIFKLTLLAVIAIMPYRASSGGFHLKTHLGCMTITGIFYMGNVILSKLIMFETDYIKYISVLVVWIFSMFMIKLYAPADTENVPILRQKDRKSKKILSYITMSITLIIALIINDSTISNILILGMLIQSLSITRIAYKLTKNKYGYEVYCQNKSLQNLV
jgi:accessory gene regulator B